MLERTDSRKCPAEYEASVEKLRPIENALEKTDWLIDQIVYKLYGLTDEEIAIVEESFEE